MTRPSREPMGCSEVNGLAGALALGAVDQVELAEVMDHLASCVEPHEELRALAGAPLALASSLEPMTPNPAVRARLMRTVAQQTNQHAGSPAAPVDRGRRGRGAWGSVNVWRGLAVAAVLAVLAFGVWNVSLRIQLATRDQALSAVAQAIAGGYPAYPISGPAGTGYVIDTEGSGSTFLVAGLESLPRGELYEMWLIDADGTPLAVGTIDQSNADLVVATLEQDLAGFDVFAVTVESEPVEAPTTDPVMAGPITN
ncbi:MAG TPA: anti-sigma factor [Candidatus Limnocylindria bacterium]|nr:anti-sigma factor [Candidatus Limnocylindria bacterium]